MKRLYFTDENGIDEKIEYYDDNMIEQNSSFIQLEFSPNASNNLVFMTLSESSKHVQVSNLSYVLV